MKRTARLERNLLLAGLLTALTGAGSAVAQALPKEGSYDFTACLSGVVNAVAFSKTQFGYSYEAMGTARSNPPGGMMDNSTVRCVVMNTSLNGKNTQNTLCETVDRVGDKQLALVLLASDGRITRDVIAGTGKFEGLQMSGSMVPVGTFPTIKPGTFQNCNHQTGSYKMK